MPDVSINGIEYVIKGSSGDASDSIKELTKSLNNLNKSLSNTSSVKKASRSFSGLKKALDFVGNVNGVKSIKAFAKGLGGVFRTFVRIAGYRLIRSAIREITQGFSEGVKNLYAWSAIANGKFKQSMDMLSTSFGYLKNSLGAAVAPIINALAPAVDFLIDKIVALINVINQLFARLSGAGSWTRAIKGANEYGDAIGGAGGAAKEALKYLAPFDELNRLPDENKGGGGGGGSDSGIGDFETVNEFAEGISDFADTVRTAIENGNWSGLGVYLGAKINELIESIDFAGYGAKVGEYINAWFTTRYWTLKTINFENLGAKIAEFLNNAMSNINFETIGRSLVLGFTNIVDLALGAIENLDWSTVGKSLGDAFRGIFNELSEWISSKDWGEVVKSIFDAVKNAIIGFDIDSFFNSLLGFFGSVSGALMEIVGEIIVDIGEKISDPNTWTLVGAWLQDLPAKFKQAGISAINALIAPMTEGFNNFIEKYNSSGLAEVFGEIEPVQFKLIPDIPEEELNKHYNEAKAKIEAESKKNPAGLSAAITSATDEIKTKPEIAAKALFTSFTKSFNKSSSSTTSKGTPIITSQAKMTSFTRNFSKNTTSGGNPIFNSQAKFTSRVFGDKFSTVFGSEAYFTSFSIKAAIQANNGALKVPTEAVIVSTSGQGKITMETKAEGGVLSGGLWRSLPKYAGGTARAHGTLFAAGEAGPEVVGHIGGRTEVLNRSQLAATMYSAVRSAMASTGIRVTGGPTVGASYGEADNEETMYRAMVRALNEANIGPEEITLDGDVVYRNVVNKNKQMKRAYGINPMLTT